MRVICISNKPCRPGVIPPVMGEYYTVVGICPIFDDSYYIKELPFTIDGKVCSYKAYRFTPLSTIDERELLEQRQTELV